ncbi:hypothetical protein [Adhaeretor mobilis]|uniref:Uncharacterized protein n=1 Tax=Adhaeretor mobilis TaxID=1930276 RepID=A0A517MQY8_9BACT|nr:hypothetical protein [Adhaeretor mobilis]QDS97289.1 hypothetical protein HG15A2_05500 [Adhaeretor mobilis]
MSKEKQVENAELQSNSDALLDEAELLIWALLDDEIADQDAQKLEKLLTENDQVRQRYIECTQMHVDLMDHFAPQKETAGEADGDGSGIISKLIAEHLPAPGINPPVMD